MAQSRRDQVQAQSYVWSRLVNALVVADPDTHESPHRRIVTGTVVGLLIAILIIVGVTVYGFVRPGGASGWRKPGVLVVEKETGSRFVYLDGRLRPVLNYASALLLLGTRPTVVSASRKSLSEVAHGQPVGIVGAPDALPSPGLVTGEVWSACAVQDTGPTGAVTPVTTLSIMSSGRPAGPALGPSRALLVTAGGDQYLVTDERRFRLGAAWLPRVLGADGPAAEVQQTWLATIAAGPDLLPPVVPGRGGAGPRVDGHPSRVGQLFVATSETGEQRRFLLQRDGLMPLGPLAYAIEIADPAAAAMDGGRPAQPVPLSPAALAALPVSRMTALPTGLPAAPPQLVTAPPDGAAWCVRQRMSDGRTEVAADAPAPAGDLVTQDLAIRLDSRTAAAVTVEPGQGGLVVAGRIDQALGSTRYLVTDAGVKYPVPGSGDASRLGFSVLEARPVPSPLLDLLPTGPALAVASGSG
ncbi:type VII secretion protein EccB [Actinoplanes sp. NPDC049596]|uniref:type VII secretion protein EccB n=1 Tax=unclassified Actinoplanes TaxID=2626549 RepID=UPI003412DABC